MDTGLNFHESFFHFYSHAVTYRVIFVSFCTFLQQQYHSKIDVLIDEAFKEMISCLVSKVLFHSFP